MVPPPPPSRNRQARMFAALGDETRLELVAKLCKTQPQSIAELTEGTRLTRQAITKHLRILEGAGLVEGLRIGRETLYEVRVEPLGYLREELDVISHQWTGALERLRTFVE